MKLDIVNRFLDLEILDLYSMGFTEHVNGATCYTKMLDQIFLKSNLGYTQIKQFDEDNGIYLRITTKQEMFFDFEVDEDDEVCFSSVADLLLGSHLNKFVIQNITIFGDFYSENDNFYCEAIEFNCVLGNLNRSFFIDSYDLDGLITGNYSKEDWIENRKYLNKPIKSTVIRENK